jgi:hypothetical protein
MSHAARSVVLFFAFAACDGGASRPIDAAATVAAAHTAPHAAAPDLEGWRLIRWDMGTAGVRDALTRDGIAYSVERAERDPVGPHGEVMHVVEEHVRFTWQGAAADAWLMNDRLESIDFERRGLSEADADRLLTDAERRFGAPLRRQARELAFWQRGDSTIAVTIWPSPGNRSYVESWAPFGPPR